MPAASAVHVAISTSDAPQQKNLLPGEVVDS